MFWVKLMDTQAKNQSKLCSPFVTVRKFPLKLLQEKENWCLIFFAVGTCDHPPLCLYYCYWYAINCCCCSHTNIYASAMNIVQYYSKKISPMLIATIHSCCNGGTCVATNHCNSALVLQRCTRVARNCCIKPLQHAFVLQQIDATECCHSIICCNVCVATHFTMNDATRIDGSYHVLLQQTYTPGCLSWMEGLRQGKAFQPEHH